MEFIISEMKQKSFTEPFTFDSMADVSELESLNNDKRKIGSVQVKGLCTIDHDEVIFSFKINGMMVLPCARTLVEVEHPFSYDVTEVFSTAPVVTDEAKEDEVHQVSGDVIDLLPYIKEHIILNIPYRVFSNEKPLEDGDGWTYLTEEELEEAQASKIDPRLEKLQQLFNKDNDETKK